MFSYLQLNLTAVKSQSKKAHNDTTGLHQVLLELHQYILHPLIWFVSADSLDWGEHKTALSSRDMHRPHAYDPARLILVAT